LKILSLIPARGGSKGIPMKNSRFFGKKPLIGYTIETAKKSKIFDKIIVSTDNKKIAKISESFGAEVPLLRPKSISTNTTTIFKVIEHIMKYLENQECYVPDIIFVLQPTSPFRTSQMIVKSYKILKNSNATSVISVTKVKEHPYISFWQKGNYLKPFQKNFEKHSIRQNRTPLFYPTGSIYAFWTKNLKNHKSIYGPRIMPLIVNQKEFNLDIDDPYDFFIGEMTLKFWSKHKKNF